MPCLPERVENCIKSMFNYDRIMDKHLVDKYSKDGIGCDIWEDKDTKRDVLMETGSLSDFAMDLLGVPRDDTVEKGYYYTFCRDGCLDMWMRDAKDADEFISFCRMAIKEYAEDPSPVELQND